MIAICRRPSGADNARGRRAREGQAIIELAVIGLILVTMSFAVLELGRAYYASVAITHAARDAARVAMNPAATDAAIISAAEAAADPVQPSAITLNRSTIIGEMSTVTVTYEFDPITPLVANLWGGGPLVFSESATSRTGWQ